MQRLQQQEIFEGFHLMFKTGSLAFCRLLINIISCKLPIMTAVCGEWIKILSWKRLQILIWASRNSNDRSPGYLIFLVYINLSFQSFRTALRWSRWLQNITFVSDESENIIRCRISAAQNQVKNFPVKHPELRLTEGKLDSDDPHVGGLAAVCFHKNNVCDFFTL